MLDTPAVNPAIYKDVPSLTAALGAGADIGLGFPKAQYAMLRWPYDLHATPAGAIALGAGGTAGMACNVSADGFCALVREIPDGANAVDILAGLAASVPMPREVRKLDDMAAGTWIIAKVSGSFKLSLDVTYGYDFSWIRQVTGDALKGDIGLRVLAGIAAQLGCEAGGEYVIGISRALDGPEQQKIRLRLFQEGDDQWSAGLTSGRVTLTPVQAFLPQDFDEFLKGVLGIQASQILNGLEGLEQWVAGADKTQLGNLQTVWNQLPQQVAAFLWSKLADEAAIGQIASFAAQISKLTPGDLDNLLQSELSKVGFLTSPVGILLESIAEPDILAAIGSVAGLQQISSLAGVVSGLLNDSTLIGLLQRLQAEINQRLGLQQIQDAVDAQDLSKLDAWMVNRLEAFLGDRTPVTLKELQQLAAQLQKLAALKDTLYSKALEALQKQYAFAFTASCQNSASATALIDLAFDFAANAAGAERGLALAVDGHFDEVLLDGGNTGVLLNQGVLTHGIRRQSSVELALPFYDSKRWHTANALATLNAVDQTGGRLIAYNGSSSDLLEVSNEWQSALSISLAAGELLAPGVTIYNPPSAAYSYSMSAAVKKLTRAGLKRRFGAELEDYFANTPIDQWLDALIGAGNTGIGDALLSLDVVLPPDYILAWMKAPLDKNALQYARMAAMLRQKFREFLLEQYFADIARYENVADGSPVFTLLTFASDMTTPKDLLGLLARIRETLEEAGRGELAGYYADDQASRIIASAASSPATMSLYEGEARTIASAKNAGLAMARFQASEFRNPAEALKQLAEFGAKITSAFHGSLETYLTGDLLLPLGALLFAEAARAFDPTLAPGSANAMFSLQVVKCSPFPPAGFPQNNSVAPCDVLLESRLVSAGAATSCPQCNRDSSGQLLRS